MASKNLQRIEVNDFKGINRSKSADDTPVNVAQLLKDMRITPDGTLERRQEYDALYDDRPSEFEHTTPDTASNERLISDIAATHKVDRSHRRKNTLIGKTTTGSAGSGEYAFVCYAEKQITAKTWTLFIHRGKRSGSDIGSWTAGEIIDVTSAQDTDGETDACWIEASMQFNAAKTTIHFAVTMHDEKATTTKVKHISFTTLYNTDFAESTPTITVVGGNAWIESSTTITRDVDIELDGADVQYIHWGRIVSTDLAIKRTSSDDFTATSTLAASLTNDIFGFSLLRNLNNAADNAEMYLTYLYTTSGNVSSLRYQRFSGDDLSGAEQVVVASGIYIGGGNLDNSTKQHAAYLYGACVAIDSDGDKNYLYRTAIGTLTHISDSLSVSTVTTLLDQAGGGANNAWDITVKKASSAGERLITVFYAQNVVTGVGATPQGVYKIARTNASAFFTSELVEDAVEGFYMFFNVYRTYEVNTAKRFSYLIGTGASANLEVKFLHSDKGMFDADFDGSLTDAGSREVQVEALGEPLVHDANGSMSQILIIQCDDNKLYKRVDYQWKLLEGQRLVDNSDWETKAETVFTNNAHIWANHGTVRFGAGNGATNQAMWYDYVDRDFFKNGADVNTNSSFRYNDHLARFSRLDPPNHTDMTLTPSPVNITEALIQDGYETFKGKFSDLDEQDYRQTNFLVAFSLVYDGFQESQLLKQTQNSPFVLGGRGNLTDLLKLDLTITDWNSVSSKRINPRVTAINVYMGNPQEILFMQGLDAIGWEAAKTKTQYFRAKTIQISRRKSAGENAFSAEPLKGTEEWTDDAGDTFTLTTYVDYNMWEAALGVPPQEAINNIGNGLPIYVSSGSGTEIYTKESFVPEGYKYGIAMGNRTYIANMRINGTTRSNRLMASAFAGSGAVTPDHLSDFGLDVIDLDYDIQGLSKIGDDILVVVGTHGIDAFNVASGLPRKVEDVVNVGTDAPDAIADIVEGGVGNVLRGVLFKDRQGHIRLFDGFSSKVISDPIRDDFLTNSLPGILNSTLSPSTAQYKYVPSQRLLFLAYGAKIFVLDFRNDSGAQWLYWEFNNDVDAMTVGVDGEMFFTDGNEVFVFPQAGTVDTPVCQWVSSSTRLPEDTRGVLKKVHVDYLSLGAVLQPATFIDGATSASNTSTSLPIIATKSRARKSFSWGKRVAREVSLELHGTSSTTGLEIHRVVQEIQIEKKQP